MSARTLTRAHTHIHTLAHAAVLWMTCTDGRGRKRGRPVGSGVDAAGVRKWSVREGHTLLDGVLAFGGQRWQDVQRHVSAQAERFVY